MARLHGKQKAGRIVLDGALYLAGSVLYALSVNVFTAPNHIAPGGATGISTILNYLFQLPIGTMIIVFNIPLLIAAWRKLGAAFTVRTAIVTVLSSVIIDVIGLFVPPFRGDMILSAVFGGVLAGVGLGLIYMRGATTGGSELLARLIKLKFRHMPAGRLILFIDAVVVTLAAVVYRNVESALYAMIFIFITTSVMDMVVYGGDKGKLLFIMTAKDKEIAALILQEMKRGVTMLDATGAYSGRDQHVLLCAVRRSEMYGLRVLVQRVDPNAFIVVLTTEQVLGEGFKQEDTD